MLLYAIRHGIAEDQAASGRDADRQLNEEGIARTKSVGRGLHALGITFDRIISSPYIRAVQTAKLVAGEVGYEDDLIYDQRLTPSARPEEAADLILEFSDVGSIAITGHEPSMSTIISSLCASGHLEIEVKKASVTALQMLRLQRPPRGMLLWSIPPKILSALGKRD